MNRASQNLVSRERKDGWIIPSSCYFAACTSAPTYYAHEQFGRGVQRGWLPRPEWERQRARAIARWSDSVGGMRRIAREHAEKRKTVQATLLCMENLSYHA